MDLIMSQINPAHMPPTYSLTRPEFLRVMKISMVLWVVTPCGR
jgi:hypothetical protein